MNKNDQLTDRRVFLSRSACFLFGSLVGLNYFSKAFAFTGYEGTHSLKPRIALIIDDIGLSLSHARRFLELKIPITFSILPWLAHSSDLALEIHSQGHEIMLHQPMEPYDSSINPGPGALYVGDNSERITRILEENILSLPSAVGLNNHMGSRFTECRNQMNQALNVANKKGLFFIDSLTTNHSIGYNTAKTLHMFAASRDIFLDNRQDESAILLQLKKLKRHAIKHGRAIGIGHPFPETANAIREFVKGFEGTNFSAVHISHVVHM